jgi:hypothetical protein
MASSYIIIPNDYYWCNDRPIVLKDCLVIVPNLNGNGSCLTSDSCNGNYGSLCEAVNITVYIYATYKLLFFYFFKNSVNSNGLASSNRNSYKL